MNRILLILMLLAGRWLTAAGTAMPADEDTYVNPVLNADFSDPDVIRVGDKYYMVASDFHFIGMQVLESEDMVNWRYVSQIYQRFDEPGWDDNQHYAGGSWAPSIRYHNGLFYVFFCTPDEGLYMTTAADARGPWSPLHLVKRVKKWEDPCPLFDDDGQAYLGRSQHGAGPIIVHRMSPDGKQLLDEGVTVYTGPVAEGTKWLKRNGYYYLIIPEGGVGQGWQTVLRSRSVYGPYERKIVLEQGTTQVNGPHQGALVDTPDGTWWFYHFQETPVLGRVVHLQPVRWQDDWPLMGVDLDGNGVGEPVSTWKKPIHSSQFFDEQSGRAERTVHSSLTSKAAEPSAQFTIQQDDDFSGPLGLQWQWNHNPSNAHWSLTEHQGWLTLHALPADSLKASRNMLTQKVIGDESESTTLLTAQGQCYAGLFCIGKQFRAIGISPKGIYTEYGGKKTIVGEGRYDRLYLRIHNDCKNNLHQFYYSTDGQYYVPVGEPFPMRAGYWKGIRVGLFCYGQDGKAEFDYFHTIPASSRTVSWDRHSLIIGGRRVCPVMGEIHYSRVPADEWQQEVRKMKEGGVTMIATYVFWNHIEEEEGIFRWDGQRNLRRFLEICKQEGVPVVLRLGPFCHGEVRNGGIPDWMFSKGCKMREQNATFMAHAERLYQQIFTQVQGLQWKDGGPVIAAQFDNEYRGKGEYLMALKKIATEVGFDLPFYTRTGWPELRTPVPFGEMLPLYGDYADGFWERTIGETDGNYYKAFNFKAFRSSTAIATEQLNYSYEGGGKKEEGGYPYFTCELGGGMATAYHRRPYVYAEDAYSMALVKLGSGSNLLGYYMYHGGTNPEGKTYLNENQRTQATNYNDMPVKNYDFQAPLGEFGQKNPHYYMLRPLHLFMRDWGETLALMDASFPAPQDIKKGDDSQLRWAIRSKDNSGFIFVNNYERLQNLTEKKDVELEACGVKLPKITIPAGCMAIFPVNVDGIRYATAQLVAKRDGKMYMMQIPGIPTTVCLQNGKTLKNVKAKGLAKPICQNIYLLTKQDAEWLFLQHENSCVPSVASEHGSSVQSSIFNLQYKKVKEAGPLRQIPVGVQKVAEEPTDEDFEQAAVYQIQLPDAEANSSLLRITYQGDCARLYADGKLIADHFQNGRPMLYGLWRLPKNVTLLELRILPMQENVPVYLPREADKTPGECVKRVELTNEGL